MSLEKIFSLEIKGVVDLSNIRISRHDLEWILDEVKQNSNIRFINWRENEDTLNANKSVKKQIQEKLVENLLKLGELVIELSECVLDEDFLICLTNKI